MWVILLMVCTTAIVTIVQLFNSITWYESFAMVGPFIMILLFLPTLAMVVLAASNIEPLNKSKNAVRKIKPSAYRNK